MRAAFWSIPNRAERPQRREDGRSVGCDHHKFVRVHHGDHVVARSGYEGCSPVCVQLRDVIDRASGRVVAALHGAANLHRPVCECRDLGDMILEDQSEPLAALQIGNPAVNLASQCAVGNPLHEVFKHRHRGAKCRGRMTCSQELRPRRGRCRYRKCGVAARNARSEG